MATMIFGLIVGLILLIMIIGYILGDDEKRRQLEKLMRNHPQQTQPVYDNRRVEKTEQLERRYALFVLNVLIAGLWLFTIRGQTALLMLFMVWFVSLLIHGISLREYLDFWRPYELRIQNRVYHLREDMRYEAGEDGELKPVAPKSDDDIHHFELTEDGEIIEVRQSSQ